MTRLPLLHPVQLLPDPQQHPFRHLVPLAAVVRGDGRRRPLQPLGLRRRVRLLPVLGWGDSARHGVLSNCKSKSTGP